MSVYKNDIPCNVVTAVESIIKQTLPPKQIIMVVDGPVGKDLKQTLTMLEKQYPVYQNIWSEKNLGLGGALALGEQYCTGEYIARMDSDDIAIADRFAKQMAVFDANPELELVGAYTQEFFDEIENLAKIKSVPEKHDDIVKFMTRRTPFCHQTIIFKRAMLLEAGGYKSWYYAEDWYLYIRMYLAGAKFYNLPEVLVYARINQATFARRGGLKYYRSIKGLLKLMRKHKLMSFGAYTKAKVVRFIGHVLVPRKLRGKLYLKYLRKDKWVKATVLL